MDDFEDRLRDRLHAASAEIRHSTPLADPEPALRRGLFLRRLHIASLAGSAAAAVLAVVFMANQLPISSNVPADRSLLSLLPSPIESLLPSPLPTVSPSILPSTSPKPTVSPRPSSSPSPEPSQSPDPVVPGPCAPYPATKPPAGIEVGLRTTKTTFVRGEPVPLTLAVQNTGLTPVTNWRPSGQKFDFWIMDERNSVWKWSDGKVFTQALEQESFAPGEKREATETWSQTQCGGIESALQPGTYTAWALWTTMTDDGTRGWWSNPIRLTIM